MIGLILIAAALPRSIAGLIGMPADRVMLARSLGQPVSREALEGVIAARRQASDWHETARAQRQIAAAFDGIARTSPASEWPRLAEASDEAIARALRLGPVDPYSWARLANHAWYDRQDPALAAAALRASYRTGSYDPRLTEARLRLMLELWHHPETRQRKTLIRQVRHLWRDNPQALARLARDGTSSRLIVAALADKEAARALQALRDELEED